jgi:hypothetical protein
MSTIPQEVPSVSLGERTSAISDAPVVTPILKKKLSEHGVDLTKVVLSIIAGCILMFTSIVAFQEYENRNTIESIAAKAPVAPTNLTLQQQLQGKPEILREATTRDSLRMRQTIDLLTTLENQRKTSRDYWFSIIQLTLLHLLLPTLTAILGYVFGRDKGD